MSRYKDQWNELYYSAYEEAREEGYDHVTADDYATIHADELMQQYYDAADLLRKKAKGE